ncbi:hypothetical protein NDU88_003990 [Pleurodeles waltl]|uniref:Uncharacterized protein n=1 Tax=Pleurodeles waltl TaxID=8319 RepID=A0AAV7QAK3_PLEWA|nr:hypothetical protein NDU88_003990 [Pleurodeles waltl]
MLLDRILGLQQEVRSQYAVQYERLTVRYALTSVAVCHTHRVVALKPRCCEALLPMGPAAHSSLTAFSLSHGQLEKRCSDELGQAGVLEVRQLKRRARKCSVYFWHMCAMIELPHMQKLLFSPYLRMQEK